jgi:hypothetical protein
VIKIHFLDQQRPVRGRGERAAAIHDLRANVGAQLAAQMGQRHGLAGAFVSAAASGSVSPSVSLGLRSSAPRIISNHSRRPRSSHPRSDSLFDLDLLSEDEDDMLVKDESGEERHKKRRDSRYADQSD